MIVVVLFAAVPRASAQSLHGSIYQADGASPGIFLFFSVTGSSFIAGILTFGAGGNGRWFGAMGSTDGVSGTGQVLSPSGFALTMPANTTLHFQLDAPGSAHGSFSTTGLSSFLNPTSGRFTRVFPP